MGATALAAALPRAWVWGDQALPTLRLSLAPQIDSFPIVFGQDKGLFQDQGVTLDLQGIGKLNARNLALFTGQLDGVLNDISSTLLGLGSGAQILITSTAYQSIDGSPMVELLTSQFSNVTDLAGLLKRTDGSQPHTIGLIPKSDMELETDALLQAQGFTLDPDRFYSEFEDPTLLATLLAAGSILGAVLPEPMGTFLQNLSNAVLISDYADQAILPSVIVFQAAVLQERPTEIENFYKGYRQAIAAVNDSPKDALVNLGVDAALQLFLPGFNQKDVPPDVINLVNVPKFSDPRALQADEIGQVNDWEVQKGYLADPIPFDTAVSTQFVAA